MLPSEYLMYAVFAFALHPPPDAATDAFPSSAGRSDTATRSRHVAFQPLYSHLRFCVARWGGREQPKKPFDVAMSQFTDFIDRRSLAEQRRERDTPYFPSQKSVNRVS